MSETVSENGYERRIDMRVRNSDKGNPYVSLIDLVVAALDGMGKEAKAEFLLRLFSWDESVNALKAVLNGEVGSDEHDNNVDKLRSVCAQSCNDAAKALLANAMEEKNKLEQRLEDMKGRMEKLIEMWPDAYKKYLPKTEYFFPKYIDATEIAAKMIEETLK